MKTSFIDDRLHKRLLSLAAKYGAGSEAQDAVQETQAVWDLAEDDS